MNNIKTQKGVSFIAAANNWRQKIRNSKLSPSTIRTYESILDSKLMPRLSNYQLTEITSKDLESLIDYYRKESVSVAYLRMIRRVISNIMDNAEEEKVNAIPEEAQAKLESAIQNNNACVLMSVLMRENLSMSKLLALRIDDVNEKSCEVTFRQKMTLKNNKFSTKSEREIQTIKLSQDSIALLVKEIRKHNLLSRKGNYSNPENLIFTDSTGALYDPAYYVESFKELSQVVGFDVTPQNLAEFVYVQRDFDETQCKEVSVLTNGKEYRYIKVDVGTKTGKKTIRAHSIEELREKYKVCKTPYSFSLTKNRTPFSEHCKIELAHMNNLSNDERKKLAAILDKHLVPFCSSYSGFTVNRVNDDFRAKFMNYLTEKHCKLSTREHITNFLREVCDAAVRKNFMRYNPFANVTLKADPVIKYHSLNENEITKILKLDSRDINNAFLQVKLLTGTRTAEALGLCWNDIVNSRQILVRHQLRANSIIKTTKNYKPRKINPPSLAFEILDKIKSKTFSNAHNKLRLIFCNDDGTPLDSGLLHEKLRATIGRDNARLHDLRVTAITVIYKTTNNLALAAREAGHSGTDITAKHYVDVVPDLQEAKCAQDNYYEVLRNESCKNIS